MEPPGAGAGSAHNQADAGASCLSIHLKLRDEPARSAQDAKVRQFDPSPVIDSGCVSEQDFYLLPKTKAQLSAHIPIPEGGRSGAQALADPLSAGVADFVARPNVAHWPGARVRSYFAAASIAHSG
jgi:hypothetical protein